MQSLQIKENANSFYMQASVQIFFRAKLGKVGQDLKIKCPKTFALGKVGQSWAKLGKVGQIQGKFRANSGQVLKIRARKHLLWANLGQVLKISCH